MLILSLSSRDVKSADFTNDLEFDLALKKPLMQVVEFSLLEAIILYRTSTARRVRNNCPVSTVITPLYLLITSTDCARRPTETVAFWTTCSSTMVPVWPKEITNPGISRFYSPAEQAGNLWAIDTSATETSRTPQARTHRRREAHRWRTSILQCLKSSACRWILFMTVPDDWIYRSSLDDRG